MKRRAFLITGGLAAAAGMSGVSARDAGGFANGRPVLIDRKLPLPGTAKIRVAFAIDAGTQVIDLAGPWEVFQDAYVRQGESAMAPGRPFELYTVAEKNQTIRATGGLAIVPTHSIESAPDPHVLVIPHFAVEGVTPIHGWIKKAASKTLLTMSVCTGAFQLAKTGLLDGRPATTNGIAYDEFEKAFPRVKLLRGPRFVETEGLSTAGGLTAGIDLSLRVVERFFTTDVAERTASFMEYAGRSWTG
jgi:transcriptional regulator GlxA family with amidase domain